ncbi:ABC transporter ATP-binding protein [Priestia sp. LL-8]|uniref:ABC transporter ATP-binding protein n=1 Tax=Priestia sp. LL-8 TaxID=3110068 RepID=UPI0015F52B5E|nr:ABC transporter ATP-binding protein [Priestia sp. LL-8]MED5247481.1 ABC transporter ATP-binding protein [Priestia sp. LL-8]
MNYKPLKRALKFIIGLGKRWLFLSVFLTVLIALIPVTELIIVKELINAVTSFLDKKSLNLYLIITLLVCQFSITIINSVLQHIKEYKDQEFEMIVSRKLKKKLLEKSSTVPLIYYEHSDFYDHLTRVEGNTNKFLEPIKIALNLIQQLITLMSLIIFLFSIHWSLILFSCIISIPIFYVNAIFGSKRFWLMHELTPEGRDASYTSSLLISRKSAQEVRIFGLQKYLLNRWYVKLQNNNIASLKLMKKEKRSQIYLDCLTALTYGGAVAIILWLIKSSSIKIGEFVVIAQSIQSTQNSINSIAHNLASISETTLYLNDFYLFLDYKDEKQLELNIKNEDFQKFSSISISNLSYRYPQNKVPTLEDISFKINKGERIAIIGENGSGKSTLIKCLVGLYTPTNGEIFVNDVPINCISKQKYKDMYTVIFQDFIKYDYTVKENIMISDINNAEIEDERLYEAARNSGISVHVEKMGQGYDTILGKYLGGDKDLSGGQWQKLAIARALFRDKEIIILDEPSSALDPLAEKEFFEKILNFSKDKTIIFISHRMQTARMADRILVMDKGKIIESGNHDELISYGGKYAEMNKAQLMNSLERVST